MSNTVKERLEERSDTLTEILLCVHRSLCRDEPPPGCLELLDAEANGWDDVLHLGL